MPDVGRAAALVVRRRPPRRARRRGGASSGRSSARSARRATSCGRPRRPRPPPPRRAASSGRRPRAAPARRTRRTAHASRRRRRSRSRRRRAARRARRRAASRRRSTAAAACGSSSAPSTSVHAAQWRTRSGRGRPGGGGSATSQSARVSATSVVPGELLAERGSELAAGAGYEHAAASRGERIGDLGAPQVLDARVGPADAVLVGIAGVVLLGDEVGEQAVGQRLEPVRADAGHVDRDRILVADVLAEGLPARRGRARRRARSPARQTKTSSWPRSW